MMQRKEQERRHFSRWGKGRRILSCFLSLIMVLSLLPGMPVMKAGATGEFDYSTLIPSDQSGDALTNLQVTFNGQKWYVVGYGDKGITTESGYVTLLAADTSFGTSAFSSSMSNTYGGSTVETALKAYTDSGSFKDVADAIRTVTLSDVSNTEAKLYLLSTGEANQLKENVRKINFTGGDCSGGEWWLRSPGASDSDAAFVYGVDGYVYALGDRVSRAFGVRPALQLNLSSVIFSSESKTFTTAPAGPTAKKDLVYNGSPQQLVTAPESGEYLYSLTGNSDDFHETIPTGTEAKTYTVYYKEKGNESATVQSIKPAIAKKEVTVAGIAVKDKVYDGTTSAVLDYTNVTYKNGDDNALVSGDTLSVTATGAFEDANVGDNKNVTISNITLGGTSAGNYTLANDQSSATGKITKKAATVTAKAQIVEVNENIKNEVGEAELSGAVDGHTLTAVTLTAGDVTTVGSSTVTPSDATIMAGSTNVTSNYEITYTPGTLTVTKTQPKLKTDTTLTAGSLTYGQKLSESTISGTMVDKANEATEVAGTFAWKEPETVPKVSDSGVTEYDVIFTPTSADYGAVELKTKVTVNAKELTVKADDKTRIAGADSNPELTYTVTGLVGTDTKATVFSGALACEANSSSPAGQTYAITQGTLAVKEGNHNYIIGTFTKGTMTVSLPEIKVDTIQPGELTSTTAMLNGSVSPAAYATSANVSSVGFKYRKAGASVWENATGIVGSTFSAKITGLTADSDYEYYAVMTVNGETTEKSGKTITFHTEKEVKTDAGKITVKVKKDNAITENPNVVVSVERGNDVIASKALYGVTTTESTVDFESLPDGNYNVVASTKDGNFTETKMLSITNGESVTADFTVLKGKIAAVVEIKEGTDTPKVAVDGLNDILDDTDKENAKNGAKEVEVKLDVEKKTEANATGSAEIKSLLSSKEEIGTYLDLSLFKTVTDLSSGTAGTPVDIGNTNTKILCIAIPYVFTGRSGFFMARFHNSTKERMTKFDAKPTGTYASEGYFLDMTAGYIFLYAKGFSTYAIGYEKANSGGSGGGGGYTPYITPTASPSPSPSASPSVSPSPSEGAEASPSPSASVEPSVEPSASIVPSAVPSASAEPTASVVPTASTAPAVSASPSASAAPTKAPADQVTKAEKAKAKLDLNAGLKVSRTTSKVTVKWGKVKKADRYDIYAAYCGKDNKCEKVLTVSGSKKKAVIKKLNGKELDRQKDIKVYVAAYRKVNGKETKIAKSITGHVVGDKNTKYTNAKSIKLKKTKYSLKAGNTKTVKAELVLEDKKKKAMPKSHVATFRYASSNTKVAKVDKNGKITAVGKGTCYIYVYAANGLAKKVKVTVK